MFSADAVSTLKALFERRRCAFQALKAARVEWEALKSPKHPTVQRVESAKDAYALAALERINANRDPLIEREAILQEAATAKARFLDALRQARLHGTSIRAIARQLGVSHKVLQRWRLTVRLNITMMLERTVGRHPEWWNQKSSLCPQAGQTEIAT